LTSRRLAGLNAAVPECRSGERTAGDFRFAPRLRAARATSFNGAVVFRPSPARFGRYVRKWRLSIAVGLAPIDFWIERRTVEKHQEPPSRRKKSNLASTLGERRASSRLVAWYRADPFDFVTTTPGADS